MAGHGPNGKIVDIEHKRLTDEDATSSQGLEMLCYQGLLKKPRFAVYNACVFDGCRALIRNRRDTCSRETRTGRSLACWQELDQVGGARNQVAVQAAAQVRCRQGGQLGRARAQDSIGQ
jgi:hypothetical protein